MESLNVAARLELTSNVPDVISQMISAFDRVNTAIRTTQDALSRLGDKSGALGRISESLDRLSKIRMGSGLADDMTAAMDRAKEMASQSKLMAESADKAAAAWRAMAETKLPRFAPPPAPPGGGSGSGRGGGHGSHSGVLMDAAIGGQIVGDAGLNVVEQGFMANAQLQQQLILLQADKRVTNSVVAKLQAQIATLQKSYPALTQLQAVKLYSENQGVFGDPSEALATLPGSVRLEQLYQLRGTGQGGTGGDENLAATKAGDALQAFINPKTKQIDVDLFNKWIAFQTKSVLAGGGIVDAKSWLTYARTARASGIGYNQDALEYTQALLELSPGRTGTALNSAFQLFGASTANLTDKTRAAWEKVGLIGKNGKLDDASGFQSNPYTWIWDVLLPKLAKQGIASRQQIIAWLTAHGQRQTVSGVFADIAIGETNIAKTKARFDAEDPNTVDKLQQSDIGKLAALATAENNFLVALGKFEEGPGVAILTGLTKGLNDLTAWATAHPELAKTLALTGAGMAILAKAAGDLALTIYLGAPLVSGLGSLAKSGADLARTGAGLVTTADGLAVLSRAVLPFAVGGVAGLAIAGLIAGLDALFGLTKDWNQGHTLGLHNPGSLAGPQPLAPAPYVPPHIDGPYGRHRPQQHAEAATLSDNRLAMLADWVGRGSPVTVTNPVEAVTVKNTGDIARGANAHAARQLQRPNTGASGVNLRLTPSGSAALAMPGFG